jgi:hypothetical protein
MSFTEASPNEKPWYNLANTYRIYNSKTLQNAGEK